MRIRFREKERFVRGELRESSDELGNPGCGWYHVYTFKARPPAGVKSVEEEAWMDESCRQEQLALALIDIGEFRLTSLSEDALLHIGRIMEYFSVNQKQLILRFVYDTEGKGMIREPLSLAMVKRHMEQIGERLRPYMENILVMQGIFVGNWGEMHGSRFLDEDSMHCLIDTLYGVSGGQCFLAVRTPAQWRRIMKSFANSGKKESIGERLALFNDGIFGSPTDLGTYGTSSESRGETESRSREEELEWQSRYVAGVPNGGEILSAKPYKTFLQAATELDKMHVCYLNSIYHPEQLDCWKGETVELPGCWQGLCGYEYIGRHLGYRFTVLDVTERKKNELRIRIGNQGFGNLCEEAECFLIRESESGSACLRLPDTDAREWKSGQETLLSVTLSEEDRAKGGRLYLTLKRRSDGRVLRFANQNGKERVYLGEYPTQR